MTSRVFDMFGYSFWLNSWYRFDASNPLPGEFMSWEKRKWFTPNKQIGCRVVFITFYRNAGTLKSTMADKRDTRRSVRGDVYTTRPFVCRRDGGGGKPEPVFTAKTNETHVYRRTNRKKTRGNYRKYRRTRQRRELTK